MQLLPFARAVRGIQSSNHNKRHRCPRANDKDAFKILLVSPISVSNAAHALVNVFVLAGFRNDVKTSKRRNGQFDDK